MFVVQIRNHRSAKLIALNLPHAENECCDGNDLKNEHYGIKVVLTNKTIEPGVNLRDFFIPSALLLSLS
jgi:hypothetical protein